MSEVTRPQVMVAALLNAISDVCRVPETGEFVVDPSEAVTCLAVAAAIIMEADPTMKTAKQMRDASEKVGRQIRHQMKFVREEFERTGERPWDAKAIPLN